jgi:hypothetical protein
MKNHHKKRLTRAQNIAMSKSASINGKSVPKVWVDEAPSLPPQRAHGEQVGKQIKANDRKKAVSFTDQHGVMDNRSLK